MRMPRLDSDSQSATPRAGSVNVSSTTTRLVLIAASILRHRSHARIRCWRWTSRLPRETGRTAARVSARACVGRSVDRVWSLRLSCGARVRHGLPQQGDRIWRFRRRGRVCVPLSVRHTLAPRSQVSIAGSSQDALRRLNRPQE